MNIPNTYYYVAFMGVLVYSRGMIQLSTITKRFNATTVLHNISCTIPKGSLTLLLGDNGAGKSTLLKIIAGVESYQYGTVSIPQEEHIAYLGHSSAMYPRFSALENLLFWTKLYKIPCTTKQCLDMLEYLSLAHASTKEVRFFSKGMIQRLAIAFLLLQKPSILLLDEPTAGLDTSSTALFHTIIQEKHTEGITIIWITHSPKNDILYASHIAQLHKSKLAFFGSATEYMHMLS